MTATAAAAADRYDFRTVTASGAKLGLLTAVSVLAFALLSGAVASGFRELIQAAIVLIAGTAVAVLPASWIAPRSGEGVAGAAAVGLCGTVTFSIIDIAVLRPLNHVVTIFPWTWDAIGGGSVWWYLPVWWMLGTLVPWMGALVVAGGAARGIAPPLRALLPAVVSGTVLGIAGRVALGVTLPLSVGGGLTIALAAFGILNVARRG